LIIKERGSIAQMGRRTMAADAMAEDVSRIVCVAATGTGTAGLFILRCQLLPCRGQRVDYFRIDTFWIDVKSPTNCNHSR
jgi:hypothetical protein